MCGVAGLWSGSGRLAGAELERRAEAMAATLASRGPDGAGVWSDAEAGLALSHRRLAVVDLSDAGAQPMASACGRYVLSFNGEIYNHRELRRALEARGMGGWRGTSDTETLLALIAADGLELALRQCVGAFAIALWDRRERRLQLARDRLGEKPLHYGWSGPAGERCLVFASELKALHAIPGFAAGVDRQALSLYLRANAVPAPHTIYRDVWKVRPGHVVTLGEDTLRAGAGAGQSQAYWDLAAVIARPLATLDEAEAEARLEALLLEAVGQQVLADVPVGAFLSGGIDSSLITALMTRVSAARVKTFTIGFDHAGFDEAPHARAVAQHLGTEHTELYVGPEAVRAEIPALADIYDEPFADSSQLPTLLVSRLARSEVTVALSGDAGDELFCGYNRYLLSQRSYAAMRALPGPLRQLAAAGIGAVPPGAWDQVGPVPMFGVKLAKVARMLRSPLDTRAIYRASSEEWGEGLPLMGGGDPVASPVDLTPAVRDTPEEAMMQWDMTGYLTDDILVKVDRASMASSLEVRVPLLDHRLVEFAWTLPLDLKKRDGRGKWLLRRVLSRHVPDALIDRPKAGFAVPVGAWLRGELRDWAEDLLSPDALNAAAPFDAAAIRARWGQHLAGTHDWAGSLWGVLMFQAWARRWGASC
ncbi:MAG: asparagine synthase (glutamine-hydrolyzing) [Erythrobacter sp.]|uniref:asparagine synthase (glutamine-hydrolyzing) n=1 Tax=Erythrobacter sp. TaxID=1042 RepID=UPI0025D03C24|nr:asparagine synthase (glutamine-hydrolyzing) [Erythrobacter sp.]MCL9998121.1 asparagine synthase (glutamine-hydrolyzing) [Erythrobacter sp.]